MADAIISDNRAPTPASDTTQGAQTVPNRDYPSEYARREEIARAEGFESYWAKRKTRVGQPIPRRRAA